MVMVAILDIDFQSLSKIFKLFSQDAAKFCNLCSTGLAVLEIKSFNP